MTGRETDAIEYVTSALERLGIIDAERFRPTVDLAWPRIVTGFAIMSKQTADLAMVGIAVGTAGTAGLAYALAFWEIVTMLGLGLAGGTISLVSQNYGGEETGRASLVVTQSVLLAVGIALPLAAAFLLFADPLIGLFDAEPESIAHGATYLTFVAPAVLFELLNLIASRTYTGVGDTFTEMVARAGGAALNILISGLLIFGFGLGVAGAAIGTTLSTGFVTVVLAWGMVGRSYGVLGMESSPVPLARSGPWLEPTLLAQIVEISAPEIGRRLAQGIVVFPLLWVAGSFGPVVVTALEVGRRVRALINSVNWGLSLAASSLVGQRLGANDEDGADAYGTGIIRLSALCYAAIAVLVVVFAEPIASLFVGPDGRALAGAFVAVGAVSSIGFSIDGAASGALLGAGDTRWPFVASLVGRYGFALPAAALGLVTALDITGLYLALLLETAVPGGINYWLFHSGRWKVVSRRYRPSSEAS
ncbi:MATE efflux family protein [Haloterrigena turkmenica DSM 5511]|uniref:Multidrug-efflux transporter n=1 Tax=Haloterrigena turkmenica (strain ATCC 51198 / DSM 5511 / JCM 9101 / NCIMB 13204 / VKM B-1734 / 4k) TaxID=543526 RepID=D2RQE6_HALTV|nr:MATE family efflux transporter [Haloterrigena turkmenica]ADB62323.1 MATE efflux family protein [Haloterrigena turkmenica DSM 5511]